MDGILMSVGVVFASTGGNKAVRAVRTFQAMEPDLPIHVTMAINSSTYYSLNRAHERQLEGLGAQVRPIDNPAFVNGCLNDGVKWMRELGHEHACLLHDDLVFSPLPEHRGSLSEWFPTAASESLPTAWSGLTFAHFECFTHEPDMRREPSRWDRTDLEDRALWHDLGGYDRLHNGSPLYPPGRDFYIRYEGTDRFRPWNRLGPTGLVVPIATWEQVGGFDEKWGVFYDIDYPAEVRRRDLAPVWACPNVPWLHLHNQSVNPWADRAPGAWGDTEGGFARKFGYRLTEFWHTNWEERWLANAPFDLEKPNLPDPISSRSSSQPAPLRS